MLKHLTKEELEEKYREERDPRVKERLLAILHEMIKSCEGVALDLFGERKQGYSRYWMGDFISAEN
ncbi:hypothetical protein AIOGIFDO_01574 [Candidatus Methanoperedenaceae archaeon GB37]|nr:hypothetical protein AIOGIFDO_01574 [Candidatus Methanoperedenaceae archaeon GB37]